MQGKTEFLRPDWLARMNEMVYAELAAGMRASAAYLADSMERKRLEQAEREEWCARAH